MMRSIFGLLISPLFVLFVVWPEAWAQLNDFDRQEFTFENALAGKNPGFESGTVQWTASGGTFAVNSGTQIVPNSKQFATWDSNSAGQTLQTAAVTVPKTGNCEFSIWIAVPSGTATHTITVTDGTNDLVAARTITNNTNALKHIVNFPCPSSGTVRGKLTSVASNEPSISLDNGRLGIATNVGQCGVDTPAVSYTPTGSWTTNTTYTGKWWRRGDRYHYEFQVALSGAPNSASLTVARAPDLTIDTSKLVSTTTDGRKLEGKCKIRSAGVTYNGDLYYNGTSNTAVVVQNVASTYPFSSNVTQSLPGTFTNGDAVICEGSVPIVGWEASQCVTPEQQRAPKITTYFSGSGTHTWSNGVTYARIRMVGGGGGGGSSGTASWGAATSGGNTTFGDATASGGGAANTVSGGLAAGGTGGSSTLGSITGMGWTGGGGGGATYNGTSYARGGQGGASCVGGAPRSTNQNAPPGAQSNNKGVGGSGAGISSVAAGTAGAGGGAGGCIDGLLYNPSGTTSYAVGAAGTGGSAGTSGSAGGDGSNGFIEITEYFGYTTAILANSVISNVANGIRIEGASIDNTGTATITRQTGSWINSVSRTGTGVVEINYSSSLWSVAPICTLTINAATLIARVESITTTKLTTRMITSAGTSTDNPFYVTCLGPR